MPATALAERPGRYAAPQDALLNEAPAGEPLPGEPAITAAWLLGRVPAALLPCCPAALAVAARGTGRARARA